MGGQKLEMSDPDAAALAAAFGGGNEDYDTFLKTVPGAKQSAPELDLKLLPYVGSLVAAPQHSAAAAAAARDAASLNDTEAEQQIRTDADVYVEVERDAGQRIRGRFEDAEELEEVAATEGDSVFGGRMNAPNSPGRLAVDNFVDDDEEDDDDSEDSYLAMVQGRSAGSAPPPKPEAQADVDGDGLMAAVEARASVEGSLWGPVEGLGAEGLQWAAGSSDALPGGCPTAEGHEEDTAQEDVEEAGDGSRVDVDEASSEAETVHGVSRERQTQLDALFESGEPATSSEAAPTMQSQPGDAWEDDVEPFALDEDFDYDAVKLTPRIDLDAEKRAWQAAQQQVR